MGFADHSFTLDLQDHSGHHDHHHSDSDAQHDPTSHSHETPDRQDVVSLRPSQIQSPNTKDLGKIQPIRTPWLLERPPKNSV
ncbi:hypothetical protein [Nitrincola tibetensis]|nr:hypothetical protein [Nitrincola tibetensis]